MKSHTAETHKSAAAIYGKDCPVYRAETDVIGIISVHIAYGRGGIKPGSVCACYREYGQIEGWFVRIDSIHHAVFSASYLVRSAENFHCAVVVAVPQKWR